MYQINTLYTLNLPYVIRQLYPNNKRIMQVIAVGESGNFKLLINKNQSEIGLESDCLSSTSQRNHILKCIFF